MMASYLEKLYDTYGQSFVKELPMLGDLTLICNMP